MICDQVPHLARGPQNETLYTRYYYTEPRPRSLIHFSGLHGVEAHLGHLIQKELLKRDFSRLPFQIVIVETINAFGFAWNRRANKFNVDLNRNSLRDYRIENPNFPAFLKLLETGSSLEYIKLLPTILKIGISQTVQTVACGQTDFPKSLFFAGHELQPELKSLEENLRRITDPRAEVVAIDVHTGLGKYGNESLILTGLDSESEAEFFSRSFQKNPVYPGQDPGTYRADGSIALLLRKIWGESKVSYICQEFGTRPFYQVLGALISENQFFQNRSNMSDADQERAFTQVSQKMLHAFFPNDSKWKKSCVELGLLRFDQVVHNLS